MIKFATVTLCQNETMSAVKKIAHSTMHLQVVDDKSSYQTTTFFLVLTQESSVK